MIVKWLALESSAGIKVVSSRDSRATLVAKNQMRVVKRILGREQSGYEECVMKSSEEMVWFLARGFKLGRLCGCPLHQGQPLYAIFETGLRTGQPTSDRVWEAEGEDTDAIS